MVETIYTETIFNLVCVGVMIEAQTIRPGILGCCTGVTDSYDNDLMWQ